MSVSVMLRSSDDSVDDLLVTRAAAKIAFDGLPGLFAGGMGIFE